MKNREIKFRAKELGSNEWVYGYYCKDYVGVNYITTIDGVSTSAVNEHTVSQFTGLIDKNGKDIYEGDQLYSTGYLCTVIWENGSFKTVYKHPEDGETLILGEDSNPCDYYIIGNIHENPELLNS